MQMTSQLTVWLLYQTSTNLLALVIIFQEIKRSSGWQYNRKTGRTVTATTKEYLCVAIIHTIGQITYISTETNAHQPLYMLQ